MADYKSSLPIRTEVDVDERVQVKVVDFNNPNNGLLVDNERNAHVKVHGTDVNGSDRILRLSEDGEIITDGVYNVTTNTRPSTSGVIAHVRNNNPDATHQTERVTAIANGNVHAMDVAIHLSNGSPISSSNPIPVFVTGSAGGEEVLEHMSASSVAKDSYSDLSYAVPSGKTLTLQKIQVAASGRAKFEIRMGTTGSETTKVVLFTTTASGNAEYQFAHPQQMTSTQSIVIRCYNRDTQAQDLYATIEGVLN